MGSVTGGVHEAGKSIDKTETLFCQERDPRFSDMYTGISGSTYQKIHPLFSTHTVCNSGKKKVCCCYKML